MAATSGTLLAALANPHFTDLDLTVPWIENRPLNTTTTPPTAATATQKDD